MIRSSRAGHSIERIWLRRMVAAAAVVVLLVVELVTTQAVLVVGVTVSVTGFLTMIVGAPS